MEKDIEMAWQKVQKQDRDDIKVKANIQSPVYPYIFFTLRNCSGKKRYRDGALYICLHFYTIPILFLYFLPCHPYILFHF